jgi:hypothetical protein
MTPRPRVVLAADWGGHRVSVMKHIDAALNELNLAVPCIRQLCAIETTDLQRVAKLWKREKARGATNTHRHPILAISIPPVNIPNCRADAYAYSNRGIRYAAPVLGEMSRQKSAVSCGHHLRVA